MNIIKRRSTVKNSRKKEYDIPQHLDLLNKWTIPKISPRIIYQMGTFEKLGLKQVVKTTEETITIDSDNQTFRLLSDNDLAPYNDIYRFMHIGLVQVAFKPLTLRGLPESFIAALRDGRNHNWKKSLIETIQTSLAYRPVYFNAYPNLQISLQDENSLSSLMLNVKLHGYDYMPGTEIVCICYRIYYKLLHTLNPMCKVIDFKNETILIETNFDKSKVVTRRPIKWEEIDFPQEWVIENATQPQNNINTEVSEIEQLNDGTVKIRFHEPISMLNDNRSMFSRISRSNSSYISPVDYIVQVPSRASTSQIRETYRCDNIKIDRDNIVKPIRRASSDLDITESKMNFPDGITVEVHNTSEGFPCLQRTVYTKFWSKLLQKNPEGKLHGQEIIDLINVTISKYYDTAHMEPQVTEDSSPFKRITRKLQMKKRLISKSEAIAIYMEEVKKDLMKNLDFDIKDDISMVSASHTNEKEDACIAGAEQEVDDKEEDLETILKRYQQQLEESSSASTAGKGKEKI
ncbi:hypothetical protein H5410_028433 [Solanum commersonii]|uniref:Uncharacterized protein n=1 Tax=Solanum commersonii TaxID=4109 RepID=A0A9J5Z411_SOLCO|nr:hypothetical protein H5410_028433 [Solanum commersonii]